MDELFLSEKTQVLATGYVAPQFERAASVQDSWEGNFTFLRSFLSRCESIPVLRVLTGVSMLKAYRKPRRDQFPGYTVKNRTKTVFPRNN